MTRGKKPVAAIDEAKKFAEKMGYRWQTNEHPDLAYDLFIFKPADGLHRPGPADHVPDRPGYDVRKFDSR